MSEEHSGKTSWCMVCTTKLIKKSYLSIQSFLEPELTASFPTGLMNYWIEDDFLSFGQ